MRFAKMLAVLKMNRQVFPADCCSLGDNTSFTGPSLKASREGYKREKR